MYSSVYELVIDDWNGTFTIVSFQPSANSDQLYLKLPTWLRLLLTAGGLPQNNISGTKYAVL